MRYLLDTNVCIAFLNGRSTPVRDRLLSIPVNDVVLCSVVKAELFFSAYHSQDPIRTLDRQRSFLEQFVSLPFEDEAALLAGQIWAHLVNTGAKMDAYDLQIAAIALAHNLILVTHPTKTFEQIESLRLEDWEGEP